MSNLTYTLPAGLDYEDLSELEQNALAYLSDPDREFWGDLPMIEKEVLDLAKYDTDDAGYHADIVMGLQSLRERGVMFNIHETDTKEQKMIRAYIETGNSAFEGEGKDHEVARILSEAADKIENGGMDFKLYDFNGNVVGWIKESDKPFDLQPGDYVFLEMETGNAAFEDQVKELEVARILRVAAEKVRDGRQEFRLMDINGNSVGELRTGSILAPVKKHASGKHSRDTGLEP